MCATVAYVFRYKQTYNKIIYVPVFVKSHQGERAYLLCLKRDTSEPYFDVEGYLCVMGRRKYQMYLITTYFPNVLPNLNCNSQADRNLSIISRYYLDKETKFWMLLF